MSAPELWSLEKMGEWMGVSEATARRMAAQPGFPEPIVPGFQKGKNTLKRWFSNEVVEWLSRNRRAA